MDEPVFPLQVFYDGACSVCAAEMDLYRQKEHAGRLVFVDISSPDFAPSPHGIAMEALMREMHAIDHRQRIYRGVEAFWAIWHAFPTSARYRLAATLIALPGVNLLARLAYRGFARVRKYLPKSHRACDSRSCRLGHGKPPQ
jgi:predicted DCC family thiol-disulfide oxidoreductase YuxK